MPNESHELHRRRNRQEVAFSRDNPDIRKHSTLHLLLRADKPEDEARVCLLSVQPCHDHFPTFNWIHLVTFHLHWVVIYHREYVFILRVCLCSVR